MLNKLKSTAQRAKRTALEGVGKAKATQEAPEFDEKMRSLDATYQAFQNLTKVGRSIFQTQGGETPAKKFIVEINDCKQLKVLYRSARLTMDIAKGAAASAAEAADNNPTQKNQAQKDQRKTQTKNEEEKKITEYETAKDTLLQAIGQLELKRDQEFQETITAMCDVLNKMVPDWDKQDDDETKEPIISSAPSTFEQPNVQTFDPPPTTESKEEPIPTPAAISDPNNTKVATDSESD